MEHEETYKGVNIRIRSARTPDGAWEASAEFGDPALQPVPAAGGFASEQDARSAALSAAAAQVDRSRTRVGKP